jgi:predicted DNA-binding transcriptional regulator AlpA
VSCVSLHALIRLAGHRASKWIDDIAVVKIERFDSREEALQAEWQAVANEKPAHNINLRKPRRAKKRRARKVLQSPPPQPRKILTLKQVLELVPVSKGALRRAIKNEEFPGPHYIGPRKLVWFDDEIELPPRLPFQLAKSASERA